MLTPDAQIRLAMLSVCRKPRTTAEITEGVRKLADWNLTNRQTGNMAARLHRAGWLKYIYDESADATRHEITTAGFEVFRLIRLGVFDA